MAGNDEKEEEKRRIQETITYRLFQELRLISGIEFVIPQSK
jgi:hypothetical protein